MAEGTSESEGGDDTTEKNLAKHNYYFEPEYCSQGWDWLLDSFYGFISANQKRYFLAVNGEYVPIPDGPAFIFEILQVKSKFATLRVYYNIRPREDLDWGVIDRSFYFKMIDGVRCQAHGFSSAIESLSSKVCEISGEKGQIRVINGWATTLSDTEYEKILKKQ